MFANVVFKSLLALSLSCQFFVASFQRISASISLIFFTVAVDVADALIISIAVPPEVSDTLNSLPPSGAPDDTT